MSTTLVLASIGSILYECPVYRKIKYEDHEHSYTSDFTIKLKNYCTTCENKYCFYKIEPRIHNLKQIVAPLSEVEDIIKSDVKFVIKMNFEHISTDLTTYRIDWSYSKIEDNHVSNVGYVEETRFD